MHNIASWHIKWVYWCLILTFMKLSHKNASMTVTTFRMHGSFMYLPSLAKTCSSGMQLTLNSDGKILCTSQMFTFLSLPVRLEISSCPASINCTILKLGMYLVSQFDFYSWLNLQSYTVVCHCIEHAYFVLRAANIYTCLNLSRPCLHLSLGTLTLVYKYC